MDNCLSHAAASLFLQASERAAWVPAYNRKASCKRGHAHDAWVASHHYPPPHNNRRWHKVIGSGTGSRCDSLAPTCPPPTSPPCMHGAPLVATHPNTVDAAAKDVLVIISQAAGESALPSGRATAVSQQSGWFALHAGACSGQGHLHQMACKAGIGGRQVPSGRAWLARCICRPPAAHRN